MPEYLPLKEIDEVRVTSVVDNSVDLCTSSRNDGDVVERYRIKPDLFSKEIPIAEHGFCALIYVRSGSEGHTLLYDSGVSEFGLLHNVGALEIDVRSIESIVISHGHADHYGGLPGLVRRIDRRDVTVILHPEARRDRKFTVGKDRHVVSMTAPSQRDLEEMGVEFIERAAPSIIAEGMILVSGEVPRITPFEAGVPSHWTLHGDAWELDPTVPDDQCVIMNVRGKGLVVVTGCSHAGIINTIRNAQRITGVDKIHGIFGGLHLYSADAIEPSVHGLEQLDPDYIVPSHCTGWEAIHRISQTLPDAFIPNSVGSRFIFRS